MIDARRWVITEAWLSLGLRIEWREAFMTRHDDPSWIDGGGAGRSGHYRYRYAGAGVWQVEDRETSRRLGFPRPTSPQMTDEDMRHELAHYLASTAEQREQVNFGIAKYPDGDAEEQRALEVERVIDAIVEGANRIVLSMSRAP